MEITEISTLVLNCGFPVAMCLLLARMLDTYNKDLRDIVKGNTEAITKLSEKIDNLLNRD